MNATSDVTVGDLVTRDFRAAAVFHRLGIDFCCGGGKPLGDVCRTKGLDPAQVVSEIDRACAAPDPAAPDYAAWSADTLTHHIVGRHHGYCRDVLPTIAAHARKLAQVHGAGHPELVEIAGLFEGVRDEMLSHMAKEEGVLFPYIDLLAASRRGGVAPFPAPFGDVGNPIRMMEAEHESVGAAMARIRALTADYAVPADACTTWRITLQELEAFEHDLHEHVHLENNVLFPKARALAAASIASAG